MSVFLSQVKIAGLLILGVIAFGTIGYWIAGLSPLDALYQTIVTVTTVGYTDLAEHVKPFTLILIGLGTLTMAGLISVVTGGVIEARLREIIGRRKVESKVRKLHDHLIVCGYGRFGRTIAAELARKEIPFVILEQDPARAQFAREHEQLVLEMDATEEESLTQAGIERSRGLLTTLGSDADNVYVTLTARQMNRKLKVVAIALDERASQKLKAAGANEVVSPYVIGGTWMAQSVTSPVAADFLKMATGVNPIDFFMDEHRIGERSELSGRMIKDTTIRQDLGVIIVAVRRADGRLVTNPSPDMELTPGDVLVGLGQHEKLMELTRLAAGPG